MKKNINGDVRRVEGRRFTFRDDLELLVPETAVQTIKQEVETRSQRETGGVLIGGRAATNQFYVVEATGPGPGARHRSTEFSPDVDHAQRRLDELREDWEVFWIGTWHKHPGSMRTLSGGDVQQMRGLVEDPDTLDEILSVIVTQEQNVCIRGYHMDASLEANQIHVSVVSDDAPIRRQFRHDAEPIEDGSPERNRANHTSGDENEWPTDGDRSDGETDKDFRWGGGDHGGDYNPPMEGDTAPTTVNSDKALSRVAGSKHAWNVPQTATIQGLFDIGIRAINDIENPRYASQTVTPDEHDVILTEDGQATESHTALEKANVSKYLKFKDRSASKPTETATPPDEELKPSTVDFPLFVQRFFGRIRR